MKYYQRGSITVFLSLIMLLILAVIMTTVEAARVNVAKVFTERALTAAMDSVLAEYYLPLFKEYHIFALDSGFGSETIQTDAIVNRLDDYMEYTFRPSKDLYLIEDYVPIENVNLLGLETTNTMVDKITSIMDYDGELLIGQAVDYMKYREVGDLLEEFLDKSSDLKKNTAAKTVLEEKQETEEELYEIDEKVLNLMRLVDGISISEKGVKTDKQDRIVIKNSFVKKITIQPLTKAKLGIENELVYNSLHTHYINAQEVIDATVDTTDLLYDNIELKRSAIEEYESLLSIDQSDMDEDEKESLSRSIAQASDSVDYYCDRETELTKSLNSSLKSINSLISGSLSVTRDALPIVDDLVVKQGQVTGTITNFESLLFENQDELGEGLYQGLSEDLVEMQKYKKTNTVMDGNIGNYNFEEMKTTLLSNQVILETIPVYPSATVSEDSLNTLKESLLSTKSMISKYSHAGLQFNYDNLVKSVESDNFFHSVKTLLEDGIMGLVIDTNSVSDKELTTTNLPSFLHKISESAEVQDVSFDLSNMSIDSKIGTFTDIFTKLGEDLDLTGTVIDGGEAIGEMLLFQEYLMDHFNSYCATEVETSLKALNYEVEYTLMGKSTDYKNLKAVIMRILLLRTILNFITLMGDSKSSGEARTMAISFVGFTGLPALICIVKAMILTIWAFTESLIDIAAMLQGKAIPLLKNGTQLQLGLYEITLINQPFIKSKAEKVKETTETIQLKYQDYLKIFLFLEGKEKKAFRALDLIQENIQLQYEDTFYIRNCLFGFQAEAAFKMNRKFVTVPFVKELLSKEGSEYSFYSSLECSY